MFKQVKAKLNDLRIQYRVLTAKCYQLTLEITLVLHTQEPKNSGDLGQYYTCRYPIGIRHQGH